DPPPLGHWKRLPSKNAPRSRRSHAVAWNGTHMLVWGGRDRNVLFSSGGLFDPEIQAWNSISERQAPEPRHEPFAAWTGREFLVWGGFGEDLNVSPWRFNALNSGGLYNPLTDS